MTLNELQSVYHSGTHSGQVVTLNIVPLTDSRQVMTLNISPNELKQSWCHLQNSLLH